MIIEEYLKIQAERLLKQGSFALNRIQKQKLKETNEHLNLKPLRNLSCGSCVKESLYDLGDYLRKKKETPVLALNMKKDMVSVVIPTYNSSEIIWLQLDSLTAQKEAPAFELILIEEDSDNFFGEEKLMKYEERLKKKGCKEIKYIKLDKKTPLSKKWLIGFENMNKQSLGMLLTASDNYSYNTRLKDSFEALKNGYDWFDVEKGYFYNILDNKAGLYTAPEDKTGLFMAISSKSLATMNPSNFPNKSIDQWIKSNAVINKSKRNKEITKGIHTDGFNQISLKRKDLYNETANKYFALADEKEVFEMLPKRQQNKIKKLQK